MESLLTIGFPFAASLKGLGLCFAGVLAGMVLGAMLGLAPTVVAFLAASFVADPATAMAMLAGLYWGAHYGRSISAILFGVPGGVAAVATTFDGHPMASRGEAGRALGATLVASLLACTLATVAVAMLAGSMGGVALVLGPTEFVALMVLALAVAVATAGGTLPKAVVMVLLGLALAGVGPNPETGEPRFTIRLNVLEYALSGYVVTLGLIVFSAAFLRLETARGSAFPSPAAGHALPRWSDVRQTLGSMLRGSAAGTLLGLLPIGPLMAPFVAYRLERGLSREPDAFGTGAIEGVAAPEAANAAGAQVALLPFLTLGIPTNAVLTVLIAIFTASGAVPGPTLITKASGLYWGTIATFWIANLMVVAIGLGTITLWVRLLGVPRRAMLGGLIALGCAGIFAVDQSIADVGVALLLGLFGSLAMKRGFDTMPMLIAFLLEPILETNVQRALLISRGSLRTFIDRPLSAGLLLLAVVVLAGAGWAWMAGRRSGHSVA